jgi:DNA-binding NarL/FixJ family response regulator
MSEAIRVAVVDDHPVARAGVEAMLRAQPGIEIVASTASPDDLADTDPTVVILDLYLTGAGPSLGTVVALAARYRVLVMSASALRADVLAALRAGAYGYLNKRAGAADVVEGVQRVAGGEFYLSSELADIVQADLAQRRAGPRPPLLSPREEQVLHYIAAGFTHAQTATRLGLRIGTVDTYVKRIRAKLGLGNKADLTRLAIELGDLDRPPPA